VDHPALFAEGIAGAAPNEEKDEKRAGHGAYPFFSR
jgi:hypothetical protein